MKRSILSLLLLCLAAGVFAQLNEVKRIPTVGNGSAANSSVYNNNTGFWIAVEATAGYSLCRHNNAGFGELDITLGYRLNEFLRFGPGIGQRFYFPAHHLRVRNSAWAMPVYFDIRGNFINSTYRDIVPYYSLDLGATIQDGFMWRPTIGMRIGQPRKAFTLGLSYVGQNIRTYDYTMRDNQLTPGKSTRYISMLALRLGYEF